MSKDVLNEKINPNYEECLKEIAELLTFLPEESRIGVIKSFIRHILQA